MKLGFLIGWPLLAASTVVMADVNDYSLSIESSVQGNRLMVAPRITGPAGTQLRYELVSIKEGPSGKSQTSQGGRVILQATGPAPLSTLSLGVTSADRYTVVVKVFSGEQLVAEQSLRYPP